MARGSERMASNRCVCVCVRVCVCVCASARARDRARGDRKQQFCVCECCTEADFGLCVPNSIDDLGLVFDESSAPLQERVFGASFCSPRPL
jgi:hypothetical protein